MEKEQDALKTVVATVVASTDRQTKGGGAYIELELDDGADYPVKMRAFDADLVAYCHDAVKPGVRVKATIHEAPAPNGGVYRNIRSIETIKEAPPPAKAAPTAGKADGRADPTRVSIERQVALKEARLAAADIGGKAPNEEAFRASLERFYGLFVALLTDGPSPSPKPQQDANSALSEDEPPADAFPDDDLPDDDGEDNLLWEG